MSNKKYSYELSRVLIPMTLVIFVGQLILDVVGITERREGFEYVTHICFALFVASLIYLLIVILLNARIRNKQ